MQNLLFICFFILPLRKIVNHICSVPLFCFWQGGIWDPSGIQDGALRDKSQRLEAITNVSKSSISYVAGVLDLPLKSISNKDNTVFHQRFQPGFGFH